MKIICVILGMLLFVQVIFIFITVGRIREETRQQMERTVDVFVEQTDAVLKGVYDKLAKLVLTDMDVRRIKIMTNDMDILNAKRNVASSLQEIQSLYGNAFGVFVYDPKEVQFYNGWTSGWDFKLYQTTVQALMDHVQTMTEKKANWSTVSINGTVYIFGYAYYADYYACAVISENNLFQLHKFKDYEKTQNFEASLVSASENGAAPSLESSAAPVADGTPTGAADDMPSVVADGTSAVAETSKKKRFDEISVVRTLEQADFNIRIVSSNNKELRQLLMLQFVTWIASAVLIILPISTFIVTKKRILDPLRYFSENLTRYQQEGDGIYFEDSRIYELEEANKLFKQNLENMKELKIRMYEETLEKQRIEMEYTKLQINPHFYINCMNQVYNMACMEDYESIQKMAANISEYFRYIFREKSDYVALAQELNHIGVYLEMCRLRYGKSFDYQVEIAQDVSDIKIPPLLLHTFVENSVKYGTGKEYGNCIRVAVERFDAGGKELVTIEVSDNGSGFPQEILERLQRHEQKVDPDGTKVGISNAIYRLNCLYQGNARLNFFNREDGGAVVKLCIPVRWLCDKAAMAAGLPEHVCGSR